MNIGDNALTIRLASPSTTGAELRYLLAPVRCDEQLEGIASHGRPERDLGRSREDGQDPAVPLCVSWPAVPKAPRLVSTWQCQRPRQLVRG